MIVLVLNRYANANEQTEDSNFVENTNKIPMNMATLDFLLYKIMYFLLLQHVFIASAGILFSALAFAKPDVLYHKIMYFPLPQHVFKAGAGFLCSAPAQAKLDFL